jgi:hypothetical protein
MKKHREKRPAWAVLLAGLTLVWIAIEMRAEPLSQSTSNTLQPPKLPKCSAAVFFGEHRVMDVEEIRTNALVALRAKGYQVTELGKCILTISVAGKEPGCAVMFLTADTNKTLQVFYNARGNVTRVTQGPMQRDGQEMHKSAP